MPLKVYQLSFNSIALATFLWKGQLPHMVMNKAKWVCTEHIAYCEEQCFSDEQSTKNKTAELVTFLICDIQFGL